MMWDEGRIAMRNRLALALSVLAVALAPAAAMAEDLPEGAFGWMDELAGHCWSAEHPDGTRDTQCYSTQYGRFLRGTIEIVAPPAAGRPTYRGDSVFVWNGERSEIAFHYWSSAGNSGTVTGRLEGDRLIFPAPSRAGAPATRMVWTRLGPYSFRVVQQREEAAGWADAGTFIYRRTASAD